MTFRPENPQQNVLHDAFFVVFPGFQNEKSIIPIG